MRTKAMGLFAVSIARETQQRTHSAAFKGCAKACSAHLTWTVRDFARKRLKGGGLPKSQFQAGGQQPWAVARLDSMSKKKVKLLRCIP